MDDWIFKLLKRTGQKYDDDQPRVPAGSPDGGQWTSGGGGGEESQGGGRGAAHSK